MAMSDAVGVQPGFIPYQPERYSPAETAARAAAFHEMVRGRRSVRQFSPEPVAREVIADLIRAAGTAPSGAHRQPWHFVAVSDPALKARIREAAEAEERAFYGGRAPQAWLEALAPIGTDWRKPFLTIAPWLIVVFKRDYEVVDGERRPNYYVCESVGIAVGLLLAAARQAGLVTLTHTPSPMGFLSRELERPRNEKPYVVIPIGYPAAEAVVPDLRRRALEEICTWR
jgi:iodotyrosine deiodinase